MAADIHKKPFDEGTVAKLEIFEDYAKAWIPTFIMSKVPRVAIFDLFAGPGYDTANIPGSAIRILNQIKLQITNIQTNAAKIDLYLNEFDVKKLILLKEVCNDYLTANPDVSAVVNMKFSGEDFDIVFERLISAIGMVPSLVYLDQNGIKAVGQKYFRELADKPQTDFLYFVSSSYFWRFGESQEFKTHLDVDISEAKKESYRFVHRYVIDQIRKTLPASSKLRLYPFSIRKGSNIYGIIFGASHPRAFDKFLRIAWDKNDKNGEANFDIDDDSSKAQPDLWGGKRLTKLEDFKKNVREKVLKGEITNNSEALSFAYSEGHLGSHVAVVLRDLRKSGLISYSGTSPLVTYENVYKHRKLVDYVMEVGK